MELELLPCAYCSRQPWSASDLMEDDDVGYALYCHHCCMETKEHPNKTDLKAGILEACEQWNQMQVTIVRGK